MSSLDYRSDVANALQVRRQTSWPKFIEWFQLEEAELSFRVSDDGNSAVAIDVVAVLGRGGEAVRVEESHSYPADTAPDVVAREVFRRLHAVVLTLKLPPPVGEEDEDRHEDEVYGGLAFMGRDNRAVELQADAIKVELARRLAADVVDALERARRKRPDLHTMVALSSGPDLHGEDEAWIEIRVVVCGSAGARARMDTYVQPGAPPTEIDERIQEAIKECEEELAKPKAVNQPRLAMAENPDDSLPF